jgi:3-methylcrotonyl-CoA carboxylase alpha subunit
MAEKMRQAMGKAAVAAAQAIGYRGAGTVEFIVDVTKGLNGAPFYFMEMNTRLQVEHPVTEMITGHDLVEWQFRVAAGEPLPCGQKDLAIDGHAIEARVYAEDASRDFMPATGLLQRLRFPAEDAHVRIDTGVREGDRVTPYYDPMIAKLIVWDRDRESALRRLSGALGQLQVVGVTTNTPFLASIAGHHAFAAADLDTGFIERFGGDLIPEAAPASPDVIALASLDILLRRAEHAGRMAQGSNDPYSPWHAANGWRLNDEGRHVLHFKDGDAAVDVAVRYGKEAWTLAFGDTEMTVQGERLEDESLVAELAGRRVVATVVHSGGDVTVLTHGHAHVLTVFDPAHDAEQEEAPAGALTAPLPGKVVQVMVEVGAAVSRGEPLMIVEAMKMEHTISAPADGKVERINFAVGEQVEEGAELLVFEPESEG